MCELIFENYDFQSLVRIIPTSDGNFTVFGLRLVVVGPLKEMPKNSTVDENIECSDSQSDFFFNNLTSKEVMSVQRALEDFGFEVGYIDGVIGRRTERAIFKWLTSELGLVPFRSYLTRSKFFTLLDVADPLCSPLKSTNVVESNSCNASNPESCTDQKLFKKATKDEQWIASGLRKNFTQDAKKCSLDCGVGLTEKDVKT